METLNVEDEVRVRDLAGQAQEDSNPWIVTYEALQKHNQPSSGGSLAM